MSQNLWGIKRELTSKSSKILFLFIIEHYKNYKSFIFFQIYKLFGISCVGCKYGSNPTRFLLLLSSLTYFFLYIFSRRRLEREQLLLHLRPWNWNQIMKLPSPPTSYAAGTSPESLCRYVWPPRKSPGD